MKFGTDKQRIKINLPYGIFDTCSGCYYDYSQEKLKVLSHLQGKLLKGMA